LTTVASATGLKVDTLDFDSRVQPTVVAATIALPFRNRAYDAVCAFQVLEHLPYEAAIQAFGELVRVTAKRLIVSLPDAQEVWRFRIYVPVLGTREWLMSNPFASPQPHEFDGEHYWEVNKRGFSLSRVVQDFSQYAVVEKTYRVLENPYHRFFVFTPAG
jgi:predicted SAM-dependent methyltransferase